MLGLSWILSKVDAFQNGRIVLGSFMGAVWTIVATLSTSEYQKLNFIACFLIVTAAIAGIELGGFIAHRLQTPKQLLVAISSGTLPLFLLLINKTILSYEAPVGSYMVLGLMFSATTLLPAQTLAAIIKYGGLFGIIAGCVWGLVISGHNFSLLVIALYGMFFAPLLLLHFYRLYGSFLYIILTIMAQSRLSLNLKPGQIRSIFYSQDRANFVNTDRENTDKNCFYIRVYSIRVYTLSV